jgi:hypothetical protein
MTQHPSIPVPPEIPFESGEELCDRESNAWRKPIQPRGIMGAPAAGGSPGELADEVVGGQSWVVNGQIPQDQDGVPAHARSHTADALRAPMYEGDVAQSQASRGPQVTSSAGIRQPTPDELARGAGAIPRQKKVR